MLWIDFSKISSDFSLRIFSISDLIVEKQSIIFLGSYRSKSYTSVVLGDSEVTFI